ncbi:helix-turn-helix domain-containing protein [Nonomuraea spiralis]|uniref:Helix-turn-helix domain-containing protein n=1 Tax=Nonomuraea spiralis TaxID=46182 RepID=A0ABV5IGR9_9ACTN|nr:recombinase family protein [Nonomuraea spiralis]GGS69420.1 hypothetical protein GCM10010176_009960 [Nonomuraea spiralis]
MGAGSGYRLGFGECPVEASGVKGITGPGLTAALGHMRRGDTLVVLDLTRLGRDTRELLAIAEDDLHANRRHFRTREGLDAARARGRVGGRPRALTSERIADARILLGAGQTRTAVAAELRVSRWTLSRALDHWMPTPDRSGQPRPHARIAEEDGPVVASVSVADHRQPTDPGRDARRPASGRSEHTGRSAEGVVCASVVSSRWTARHPVLLALATSRG